MVCRMGTAHRLLIHTRWEAGRRWYVGTLTDTTGRPARRAYGGRPVRGHTDIQGPTVAPIRQAPLTAAGLTELLIVLDGDAELFR
jgi:hypothetical protein